MRCSELRAMALSSSNVKTALLTAMLLVAGAGARGSEDSVARPTFFHTKHLLPPPWKTGEVTVRADYPGKQNLARLRSLTITVGKRVITVPTRILSLFPGAKLGSFELFCGPPPDPFFGNRRYFNVTFRYFSNPDDGLYFDSTAGRHRASIIIEDGKIKHLTKIEEVSDTVTTYTDIDPKTLKETKQGTSTKVQ